MEAVIRHLIRSRSNRVFAGVCGGLADYLGWNAVTVRIAYVVLTVLSFGTAGVVLYLLAWMVIPLGDEAGQPASYLEDQSRRSRARLTVGALLVILGVLAFVNSLMPWFWHAFAFHASASVVLIVIGLLLVFTQREERNSPAAEISDQSSAQPDAPPRTAPKDRLVRRHQGRKIAGVCVGLGEFFGMDPTIVRLLFLVLLLAGGSGLLLYVILWIVMPLETA